MPCRSTLLALFLSLLTPAVLAQAPAPGQYVLQWNGQTVAKFSSVHAHGPSDSRTVGTQGSVLPEPLAPSLLLNGGDNYPALARWNDSHDSRTVELVTCSAGRPVNRQTYYGASPRSLRITSSGIALELGYASSIASAVGGNTSLCSAPPAPVAVLFDRRFGSSWTVRTPRGADLWRFQSRSGAAAAYFRDRENTTVTIELAGNTYVVNYLGCEYQGVPRGNDIVLRPAGRGPGTCSGGLGRLSATIVR